MIPFLCHTVIRSAVIAAHVFVLLLLQLKQPYIGISVLNLCLVISGRSKSLFFLHRFLTRSCFCPSYAIHRITKNINNTKHINE